MANHDLNSRVLALEEKVKSFEARYLKVRRAHGRRLVQLTGKIDALKTRIKDLDPITQAALAAFGKTHTWLPKALAEFDYTVLMAADRLYQPIHRAKKEVEVKSAAASKPRPRNDTR